MSRRLGHTQGPRAQLPDLAVPATAGQLSIRCLSVLGHNWATSGPHLGHIFTCMEASDSCVTGSVRVALALSAGVPHGTLGPARRPLPATSCGHITAASATGSGGTAHPPVSPPAKPRRGRCGLCRAVRPRNTGTGTQSASPRASPSPRKRYLELGPRSAQLQGAGHRVRAAPAPAEPDSDRESATEPGGGRGAGVTVPQARAGAGERVAEAARGSARKHGAVCVLPQREGHSL